MKTKSAKETAALGKFGVFRLRLVVVQPLLDLASEFREDLCAIHHAEHRATIELRNTQFPQLYAALVEYEHCRAWICRVEGEIKAHHSDVQDRNAVTPEQEEELRQGREARDAAAKNLRVQRAPWVQMLRDFRAALKAAGETAAGEAGWKSVKTLARRRELYAGVTWPTHVADYARLRMDFDIRQRELHLAYHERGLGSDLRAEIAEASKPKLTKTGPGMRYEYGRPPRPKPWEKLTLQLKGGGLSVAAALAGESRLLSLTPLYANHPAGGTETYYAVRHQAGTRENPLLLEYRVKFHRELPADATIQRWSLVVRDSKAHVVPLLSGVAKPKQTGSGTLFYDLTWRRRKAGVQVCYFWGDHVNEALVLPNWLVERRLALKDEQQACDLIANHALTARGLTPAAGQRQGTDALEGFVAAHPEDEAAALAHRECQRRLSRALKESRRAQRSIEKIYQTVASRVCRRHAELRADPIDLAHLKRYDTRDLLREDVLTPQSRERLHALAPGKLSALLKGFGLADASGEVVDDDPGTARPDARTDLFTSWLAHLGRPTGTKVSAPCRRSQLRSENSVVS